MEISAVLNALKNCKEDGFAEIYSDSQYVCNAFEKGWLSKWFRNGWKSSSGKPVLNQELWKELAQEAGRVGIRMHWVKGHVGNPFNERCDQLANAEASKYAGNNLSVPVSDDSVELLPFEKKRKQFFNEL